MRKMRVSSCSSLIYYLLIWFSICQSGVESLKKHNSNNKKLSDKLNKEGIAFVQQNNHKKAKQSFQQALELDRLNPERWANLGRVQVDLGEYENAISSLKQGLSLSPHDKLIKETLKMVEQKKQTFNEFDDYDDDDDDDFFEVEVNHKSSKNDVMFQTNKKQEQSYQKKKSSNNKKTTKNKAINNIISEEEKEKKDPKSLRRPKLPKHAPIDKEGSTMVECLTTTGTLYIEVFSAWAPLGTARFLDLVNSDFFSSKVGLFRVVPNWVAQFGISGNVSITQQWEGRLLEDDKQWLKRPRKFNKGFISFAGGGPNTRNTQLFITLANVPLGDAPHEVPFGRVITPESFKTMSKWHSGYGELSFFGGQAPDPDRMLSEGVSFLEEEYPELDYVLSCEVMSPLSSDVKADGVEAQTPSVLSSSSFSSSTSPSSSSSLSKSSSLITRTKDIDYNRTIPPPPHILPQYKFESAKTYHPDSHEHSFFWWLPALRSNMEQRQQVNYFNESSSSKPYHQRYLLNPNELHVVEDFVSKEERVKLRQMTLRMGEKTSDTVGDVKTVYKTSVNEANNLVSFPPVFEPESEADKKILVDLITKVSAYANNNLYLNGTIGGPHNFSDNIGIHLGIFAVYEYIPDVTKVTSRVAPHTDTDYDGRCLSAGIHLDNWGKQKHSSMFPSQVDKKNMKKKKGKQNNDDDESHENLDIEGGVFQVMECTDADCTEAAGKKLGDLHEDFVFHTEGRLKVTEEAEYKPGRLVFFLPESPHTVTPLTKNTRAILFMWFNCVEFENPPVKNSAVQASLNVFEEKVKQETMRKNKEKLDKIRKDKEKKNKNKKNSASTTTKTKKKKRKY